AQGRVGGVAASKSAGAGLHPCSFRLHLQACMRSSVANSTCLAWSMPISFPWSVLEIEPGANEADIRKAYARKLKARRPDEDAAAFQTLVQARDLALAQARARNMVSAAAAAPGQASAAEGRAEDSHVSQAPEIAAVEIEVPPASAEDPGAPLAVVLE